MSARLVDQQEPGPGGAAAPAPVRPRRVVFAIGHMGPGGAQRVVANAANSLVERGLEMHIVTISRTPADAYKLDPAVVRHRLTGLPPPDPTRTRTTGNGARDPERRRGPIRQTLRPAVHLAFAAREQLRAFLRRRAVPAALVRQMRKEIRAIQPDCVVSFLTRTNIIVLLATRRLRVRTLVSERNDPRLQRQGRAIEAARRFLYRRASLVTANTKGALAAMADYVPKEKLAFLPNPLVIPADRSAALFRAPTFVTVARLVEQKGIDTLVRAAAIALPDLPGWRLTIVGDGPLRSQLEALGTELGIADRIDWIGHVDDPFPYLRAARFFVMPSRFEGSPNALLEAMSCGLASIVTDASPGPIELIGQDGAGLVVPVDDAEALGRSIVALAEDEGLRGRYSAAAIERVRPHLPEVALATWVEVIA
ncbi:MAG: glycosyltransferase [Bauldia sp.]|nr:glycosyltransferase [Bauldia sp.]